MYKLKVRVVSSTPFQTFHPVTFEKNLKTLDIYDNKNKMGLSASVRKEISRQLSSLKSHGWKVWYWEIEKDNKFIYRHIIKGLRNPDV